MLADHRIGPGKSCINEYIACGGSDEIAGQVIGSDVVEIAGDAKRGEILDPLGLEAGKRGQFLCGRRASGARQDDDGGGEQQEPGKFWHRFEMMRKDMKTCSSLISSLLRVLKVFFTLSLSFG